MERRIRYERIVITEINARWRMDTIDIASKHIVCVPFVLPWSYFLFIAEIIKVVIEEMKMRKSVI